MSKDKAKPNSWDDYVNKAPVEKQEFNNPYNMHYHRVEREFIRCSPIAARSLSDWINHVLKENNDE